VKKVFYVVATSILFVSGMTAGAAQKAVQATKKRSKMKIEFLYFASCPAFKQALANIKAALQESGQAADLKLINVESPARAEQVGFQGSVSIRVNGKDLDGRDEGFAFGCRVYQVDGKITAIPTKEFIKQRIQGLTTSRNQSR
jgi:hypothetical protein